MFVCKISYYVYCNSYRYRYLPVPGLVCTWPYITSAISNSTQYILCFSSKSFQKPSYISFLSAEKLYESSPRALRTDTRMCPRSRIPSLCLAAWESFPNCSRTKGHLKWSKRQFCPPQLFHLLRYRLYLLFLKTRWLLYLENLGTSFSSKGYGYTYT